MKPAEIEMHTTFRRLYDRPCPAVGCPWHAARDGAWLVCAGGHRMKARLR